MKGLIFDKFEQIKNPQKWDTEGSGLGLYIAKMFAQMMGGEITLESKIDEGSTFTIIFPATKIEVINNDKKMINFCNNTLERIADIEFSDII